MATPFEASGLRQFNKKLSSASGEICSRTSNAYTASKLPGDERPQIAIMDEEAGKIFVVRLMRSLNVRQ